ncbi:MAG: LuxR C-terminal-related transcriptional regulator [Actinomycetota bacterium]
METGVDALVKAGDEALRSGEWANAEHCYRTVLETAEAGEALFGLGIARWWSGDTDEALRCWERAYAVFRRESDPGQAVLSAVYLCLAFRMSLGNDAAARGWVARAAELVEELQVTPMRGWVLFCRAYLANDEARPHVAERWAREALELAREGGDADLALCAMSELGAALVEVGNVEEGATLLDQAMAAALAGEGGDLDTVVLISCRTITTCSRAADIKRAVQWIRAADDFNRRHGSTHLYTTCRTHYGSVLFAVGDWQQAEEELQAALKIGRRAEPVLHAQAAAKLAELRLAQGRLDDAERLLAGLEDQPATTYARAALHIARAAPKAASALVRRRLGRLDQEYRERARLLDLLVEALVAQGDHRELAGRLEEVAAIPLVDAALVAAHCARAVGRGMAARGERSAVEHLEAALSAFGSLDMTYECGRTRLVLAQVVAGQDKETAVADARAALACFEQLGAAREADAAAAVLRSLGVRSPRTGPKGLGLLTKRELEILGLLGQGLSNRDIAERLYISRRTVEHHVASVLGKLGLSGRAEAAAYAVRHLDGRSAPG